MSTPDNTPRQAEEHIKLKLVYEKLKLAYEKLTLEHEELWVMWGDLVKTNAYREHQGECAQLPNVSIPQYPQRQVGERTEFFTPDSSPSPSESIVDEIMSSLKHGCYWKDNGIVNRISFGYMCYNLIPDTYHTSPNYYLELKTKERAGNLPLKSIYIHSSKLNDRSTQHRRFEFKPNHVDIPEFKLFQTEKSLSEIQLCKPNGVRIFGISNEVFGMVIDASRVGKGLTFNKQLNEWEPGSMLYRD